MTAHNSVDFRQRFRHFAPQCGILKWFVEPPEDHFFLLGPSGTGKTSWTQHRFPDALRIDLLDPVVHRELAARPEKLTELAKGNARCRQIVLDEVQKLPNLLEVVHAWIEEKTGQQFILTGSSARKLRKAGINLLGGRAAHVTLHPYMATELGQSFELKKALHHGMLPIVWGAKDPQATFQAYNGLYLRALRGIPQSTGARSDDMNR